MGFRLRVLVYVFCMLLFAGCIGQDTSSMNGKNSSIAQNKTFISPANTTSNVSDDELLMNVTKPDTPDPPQMTYSFQSVNDLGKPIVYYFSSSSGCPPCPGTDAFIDELKSEFAGSVEWQEFDLQNQTQGAAYWAFANITDLPDCLRKVPLAYIGNTTLIGPYEINDSLEDLMLSPRGVTQ